MEWLCLLWDLISPLVRLLLALASAIAALVRLVLSALAWWRS